MKVAVFSTRSYDRDSFTQRNRGRHELVFFEPRLAAETASLAQGFDCVCAFVNDELNEEVLKQLHHGGTRLIALRSAGFNHVQLDVAERLGMTVVRVPAYSPNAIAEHTVGLILSLNRKIHRAYGRVREANFSLDGLLGFDLVGKTVGVVGIGRIGIIVVNIMKGFGCRVLAYDVQPSEEALETGAEFTDLDTLFRQSDIITLHCPLTPESHYLIDEDAITKMKTGVMLINTGRGAIIDTRAVINGLKQGKIGHLGLDVYEEEADLFFEDLSEQVIHDDVFARLLTFPNVLITGHQAFFTEQALTQIADITLENIRQFESGERCENEVTTAKVVSRLPKEDAVDA
ncbi:MAG: 2-hydroxyacid dehydrogenase [Planctomycetota bacterium]